MSSRALKKELAALLAAYEWPALRQALLGYDPLAVINSLFPLLCREEPRLRWLAISSMGVSVARLANEEMEAARIVMRRFLWSLNDESGGIGWGAPEAMAEAMFHHAQLAEEYVHMLISYMRQDGQQAFQDGNFLEHPLLQRGLLWGLARLSEQRPALLLKKKADADVPYYLGVEDNETKACAILACGRLRIASAQPRLTELLGDDAMVYLYHGGRFQAHSLAELAAKALVEIMA